MSIATDSPIFCYVTDRKALAAREKTAEVRGAIQRAIDAGADWIQIREKDLAGRVLLDLTREAVAEALGSPTKILVNDRFDIAIAGRAAGVHLGRESLPVSAVASWRERQKAEQPVKDFVIGASCHSIAEALAAEHDRADYIIFGPVFETPSKAGYGSPQGIERLREMCKRVGIPVLAIGGISAANAAECIRAGASGVAAIRLFQEAGSVEELRETLRQLRGSK